MIAQTLTLLGRIKSARGDPQVVRGGQCQGMDSRLRGNDDGALPCFLVTARPRWVLGALCGETALIALAGLERLVVDLFASGRGEGVRP